MKLSDEFIECILYETKNAKEHADYLIECGPLRSAFEELKSLREKDRWIYALETLPEVDNVVLGWIYNHNSNRHMGIVLKRVKESDCTWRTVDDNSELHNGVDVLYWKPITPPQEGS